MDKLRQNWNKLKSSIEMCINVRETPSVREILLETNDEKSNETAIMIYKSIYKYMKKLELESGE